MSDLDAGEVVVLDAPARKEIKRIPLGKIAGRHPDSADRRRAPTSPSTATTSSPSLDLKTWQVTKKISTGTGPDGMAWVP